MEISVIIPCYNSFRLMKKCLQALEKQTFKDFEVIVVDDCSKDDSFEELLKYSKKSSLVMKIYKTSENIGPGGARNLAIKHAEGKYFSFCDSDDWYEDNFLELMYNKIKKDNANVVMCNYKKVFEKEEQNVDYTFYFKNDSTKNRYIALSKTSLWLLMIQKKLFEGLEIPQLKNGEDMAIVPIILSRAERITSINNILYNYYIRNGSQSNKPDIKIQKSLLKAYQYIEDNLSDEYINERQFIGIRTVLYGVVLNSFKAGASIKSIRDIVDNFNNKNKNWEKNIYLNEMGTIQKVFIKLVKYRLWVLVWILSKLHYIYTKK